ncbi:MAG: ABC transporter permease [Methanosphaera stadtmanae]|nr:ABC transporter permease [Methanosphaera stadtmanae]
MSEIQIKGLNDFNKYKSLLSELVRKDIKIKYRNSVLGVLWSFLDPLFRMIVLTVVFSALFNRVENYPVYYLSGHMLYALFVGASTQAMVSLVNSAGIWKSIYVPKYLYALSAVLSNFVTYLLSLLVLFAIMLVTGVEFTVYIIFMSLPILITLVMAMGAGLILGTMNVFFRDVEHLYRVFTLMLMYALPLFYPAEIIPEQYKFIQVYNPMFYLVNCSRDCFLYGKLYGLHEVIIPAVAAIILLAIGIFLLRRYQDRFILYV